MTSRGRTLTLKVVGDVEDARRSLKNIDRQMSGFGKNVRRLGGLIAGAFAVDALAEFAGEVITLSSDVAEATSKVEQLFGSSADAAKEFAEEVKGYSRREALEGLGAVGNVLRGLDFPADEAAAFSQEMLTLAADVGSFNNVASEDVLAAFVSGLTGERERLKSLGIVINEAAVQAKALELGILEVGETLSDQDKAVATYQLILEKTEQAQGDLERTSDSLANRTRELEDAWEDAKVEIGDRFLPILLDVWDWIENTGIPLWSEWGRSIKEWWDKWVGPYVARAWDRIIDFVTTIVALFQGEWAIAGEAFRRFLVGMAEEVVGALSGMYRTIVGWIGSIGAAMSSLGRGAANAFIRAWNSLDPRISISIPSWVPLVGGRSWTVSDLIPDIPYLAEGGIVRSPTVAMLGEAGPEAVVPLSSRGALGNHYSITVQTGIGDPLRIAEEVVDAIRYYERTTGPAVSTVGV